MQTNLVRLVAIMILFGLILSAGSALASEALGDCVDCCGESACNDCVFCWCCSVVPAEITPANPTQAVNRVADQIEISHEQSFESLSLELLDPPPRS